MRNIVCTQCGCTTFVRTDSPFGVSGQYVDSVVRSTLRIYACCECGHLEFFDPYTVDKHYESKKAIESITNELQILRKRLADLESPSTISKINDEIKQLERQLTSLDITIRQQQEYKAKVQELKAKSNNIPNEIRRLKEQIEALERKLREAERTFENIEVLEG